MWPRRPGGETALRSDAPPRGAQRGAAEVRDRLDAYADRLHTAAWSGAPITQHMCWAWAEELVDLEQEAATHRHDEAVARMLNEAQDCLGAIAEAYDSGSDAESSGND